MSSTSTGFKIGWVFLRVLQLIFAAVVIGVVGRYLRLANDYHAHANSQLVYTQAIAILSAILALLFGFPWSSVFYMFPIDFGMWIMWMVSFGLQVHLAGGEHCNSDWYWHNWGWYWGRPVRAFPPNFTQADVGENGCSAMRTVWAFSFLCGWMFFLIGIVGAYAFVNLRNERKRPTEYVAEETKEEGTAKSGSDGSNSYNTETGEKL